MPNRGGQEAIPEGAQLGLGVRTAAIRNLHMQGALAATSNKLDLALNGHFGSDRTLSGFYDSTDPDNLAYQLSYRGARSDVLRVLSVGEIEAR